MVPLRITITDCLTELGALVMVADYGIMLYHSRLASGKPVKMKPCGNGGNDRTGIVPVRRSVLLIPAYNPDGRLLRLAEEINMAGGQAVPPLVVVDDGSAPSCRWVFDALKTRMGCKVLRHETNRGKGAALKTGMAYILEKHPEATGIVTADADLQHLPQDILRVAKTLEENPGSLTLGHGISAAKTCPLRANGGIALPP
jgi:hypothetical protein